MIVNKSGCIISLSVPQDIGELLVVKGYETVEDLHITLAKILYDNDNSDTEEKMRFYISNAVLKMGPAPSLGYIKGVKRFECTYRIGKDAIVFSVYIEGIYDWRDNLVELLEQEGVIIADNYIFSPHITVAYIDEGSDLTLLSRNKDIIIKQIIDFNKLEIRSNNNIFKLYG